MTEQLEKMFNEFPMLIQSYLISKGITVQQLEKEGIVMGDFEVIKDKCYWYCKRNEDLISKCDEYLNYFFRSDKNE